MRGTVSGWTRRAAALASACVLVAAACADDSDSADDGGPPDAGDEDQGLRIEVVSSQPEYVTGGDAVVAVIVDEDADPADVEVSLDGADIGEVLEPDPDDDRRLVGLVDGLAEGENLLEARAGDDRAELTLTNHPTTGPVFSGEHLPLVVCTTDAFGLDSSTPEDDCVAPPRVTWQYVDTAGDIHDLDDPTALPDDVEIIEEPIDGLGGEVDGVAFVIRNEVGVLNRSVYEINVLEPQPDPDAEIGDPDGVDTSAWNGRLVYRFGGGCGTSFSQGGSLVGAPSLEVLRRGYATAAATFTTFQTLCNDLISAETASMVKEHVIETYGEVVHTIGEGGSGGAIQQLLLAQNQPGLLDGIAPSVPFPDALSISPGVFDCALLVNYYATDEGSELSSEQRTAIAGHATDATCELWNSTFVPVGDPTTGCDAVPPEDVYDPETNPEGLRCTAWETNVAVAGRDPETGFARPGYDNQGVQYGLDALNDGVITPDEFLHLNENIGGLDIDGQPQPDRSIVDEDQAARGFETGRVTGPWGGLPDTAIILIDLYTDDGGDIHDRVRAFSIIDRLAGEEVSDAGNWPANVSLWTIDTDAEMADLLGQLGDLADAPTFALDEWLTAASEYHEREGGGWQDALAATKPESAESRCLLEGSDPIVGPDANDDPACQEATPIHEEPRMAAGAPRSGDALKCELIPVEDATDQYEVDVTDEQMERLEAIFPHGVCDYSQPAVGYGPPAGTWLDFTDDAA
jgi:hypothetical protein